MKYQILKAQRKSQTPSLMWQYVPRQCWPALTNIKVTNMKKGNLLVLACAARALDSSSVKGKLDAKLGAGLDQLHIYLSIFLNLFSFSSKVNVCRAWHQRFHRFYQLQHLLNLLTSCEEDGRGFGPWADTLPAELLSLFHHVCKSSKSFFGLW